MKSRSMAFTQWSHPPILPIITTHIYSLSSVSFRFRIPMLMLEVVAAWYACYCHCYRSPPSFSAVLTLGRWKVITCSRRKKVIVVGRYERLAEATSRSKRPLLSGVVVCRWKAWKPSEGNKLEVTDA
ncbi:unnamed protein product [Tuber aestivum]|uniref:Uncharacterized protein n=1 Tax=Tuber aestivum TaxID=59557 RepID=A0A292Q0M5_9PEZI|nr:unnamed protein product [Tuber aestivum]